MGTHMTIDLLCVAALILLACMVGNNEAMDRRKKQPYMFSIVLTIVSTVAGLCAYCARGGLFSRGVNLVSNAICLSLLPFIPLLLAAAFGKKRLRNAKRRFLPPIFNAVMSMSSIGSGLIFTVTKANEYVRGPLYFLFVLTCVWGVFVFFTGILSSLRHYRSNMRFSLVFLVLFISCGILLQLIVPESSVIWVCVAIALFMYYSFICELNIMFDTLTNMYNRRVYDHDVIRLGSQAYATVVFFDVDEFKTINDTYGHLFGDHCLEVLAGYIWEVFSPYGNCYRIGGDEFCFLSQEMDERLYRELFIKLNQRIQVAIARDPRFPGLSYGSAHYIRDEDGDFSDAIHEADLMMYENKRKRKHEAELGAKRAAL